jgi:hypothetical protein
MPKFNSISISGFVLLPLDIWNGRFCVENDGGSLANISLCTYAFKANEWPRWQRFSVLSGQKQKIYINNKFPNFQILWKVQHDLITSHQQNCCIRKPKVESFSCYCYGIGYLKKRLSLKLQYFSSIFSEKS